jgi:putative transposase
MSEDGAFWEGFLRKLVASVKLVISDAHEGLMAAARKILTGSA